MNKSRNQKGLHKNKYISPEKYMQYRLILLLFDRMLNVILKANRVADYVTSSEHLVPIYHHIDPFLDSKLSFFFFFFC